MVQMHMTGHGCFRKNQHKIGKEPSLECLHCDADFGDGAHTLIACPAWSVERTTLINQVEEPLDRRMVERMLKNTAAWEAVANFYRTVMRKKKEE
jgi:hypothetical protein